VSLKWLEERSLVYSVRTSEEVVVGEYWVCQAARRMGVFAEMGSTSTIGISRFLLQFVDVLGVG